jgi:hypothetical protein
MDYGSQILLSILFYVASFGSKNDFVVSNFVNVHAFYNVGVPKIEIVQEIDNIARNSTT